MTTRSLALRSLSAVLACMALMVGTSWAAGSSVKLTADNTFQSASVSVAAGDTVNFVWEGGFHDVTFADGVGSGAPVGDVGTTYSRTFDTAGSFAYVCTIHQAMGMVGTVTVAAAGAPSAGTTPAATGGAAETGGAAGALPFTGPEASLLPILGAAMAAGGAMMLLRLRRSTG